MAKQDTHHVVPNPDGGWNVKRGGGQKASHHTDTFFPDQKPVAFPGC